MQKNKNAKVPMKNMKLTGQTTHVQYLRWKSKQNRTTYYYLYSSKLAWIAILEPYVNQKFFMKKINRSHIERIQKI